MRAARQYATTTGNLAARIAIHAYSTNPRSWYSWLQERLPLHGDLVEVGAGTGELWSHVEFRGARRVLVDFSPAMCARLRGIAGAEVVRADAARLPFPAETFDALIANHMLYHVDDPDAALREFARVLRPGGRIAVAVNGSGHMAELNELATRIGRPDLAQGLGNNGVRADTTPALVERHFTEVTVERYPCDLDIPTVEPILAYLDSMSDEPLTEDQVSAARSTVDIPMRVRKHTVLISARR